MESAKIDVQEWEGDGDLSDRDPYHSVFITVYIGGQKLILRPVGTPTGEARVVPGKYKVRLFLERTVVPNGVA